MSASSAGQTLGEALSCTHPSAVLVYVGGAPGKPTKAILTIFSPQ